MKTSSNLLTFFAALLCTVPAFAAEPILLADTNTEPARDLIGGATSIGDTVVFASGGFSAQTLRSWNDGEYTELATGQDLSVRGADGLALITTNGTRYVTDGTVDGTHEIELGDRALGEITRVNNHWLTWEFGDPATLWSVTADGDVAEVGKSLFTGALVVRDGIGYFADENCDLRSTDGGPSQLVISPPNAGAPGRPVECIVANFGSELAILQLNATKIWVTEGGVSSARELPWIGEANWITGGAGGLFYSVGPTLWFTDGTQEGTVELKTFLNFVSLENVLSQDDRLVFQADSGLWVSDGSAEGTVIASGTMPVSEPVFRDGEGFWIAENQTLWTISTGDPSPLLELPEGQVAIGLARSGVGLVLSGRGGIWAANEARSAWVPIWPDRTSERTQSGEPRNFFALETVAVFTSSGSEDEEFPQSLWVTDGTPDGTRRADGLEPSAGLLVGLGGDRALGYGVDEGYFIYDAEAGATAVQDRRALDVPMEELLRFDLVRANEQVYIAEVWFSESEAVGIVSKLVDDRLELFAQFDLLPPDGDFEPIALYVNEEGRPVVTTPSCRSWEFDDDGVPSYSEGTSCKSSATVRLAAGDMEFRNDGVWLVSESPAVQISEDPTPERVQVIGGEAFYFRDAETVDGEPIRELAATDGTVENTRTVLIAPNGFDERTMHAGNGRLYLRLFDPDQLIEVSPAGEVVALTPAEGDGRSSSWGIVILGDQVIYSGFHETYGAEPFAVAAAGSGESVSGGESPTGGAEAMAGGCGCAASGDQLPFAPLLLLTIAGLVRRRRNARSDLP